MWTTNLVLSVVFSYSQVFGQVIPDVTTIYEIGKAKSSAVDVPYLPPPPPTSSEEVLPTPLPSPLQTSCFEGVAGHVHSRNNALGMGLIDEEDKVIDINNGQLPNITFDGRCLNDGWCTNWKFENSNALSYDVVPSGKRIKTGNTFKLNTKKIVFKVNDILFDTCIIFKKENYKSPQGIEIVISFSRDRIVSVYHNCGGISYGSNIRGFENGIFTSFYCGGYYTNFQLSNNNDLLTFDFSERIQIYQENDGYITSLVDWNYSFSQDIDYFTILEETPGSHSNPFSLVSKVLNIDRGEIVSPVFTPQSDDICLAIQYYSTNASLSPEVDISVFGSNDQQYSLDTIQNIKSGWNIKLIRKKLRDMSPLNLKITKTGVTTSIKISRIASCHPEGEEVVELTSRFRICPDDRTSRSATLPVYTTEALEIAPVKEDTDKKCWNGGKLTSAGCACPPGFMGPNCQIGCGRNKFGQDCEGLCSLRSEECRGLLMCTKFTDCHCAPGFSGDDCTKACEPGWYGNDCLQRCNHCAGNSSCDIYTGECSSCEEGYLAPHCKLVSAYYGSKPELISPVYGTIIVSFDPNKYVTEAEPPQLYQIQFRIKNKGEQWKVHVTKPLQTFSETSEKEKKISEKIEGLKIGIVYQVRVLLMDGNLMKYDGHLVQEADILSKCDVPVFYDYKPTSIANTSSVTFSWRYDIDQNSCPLESFEVTWKEGWKWPKTYIKNTYFTLTGLSSGAVVKFKVRAVTTGGLVPYSKPIIISTQQRVPHPPVQNLQVGSRQSTSVEISWEPPIGSEARQIRYTIAYKCVDRPACSPGCQDVAEGQLTQEGTTITLSSLLPFTKYLVTVSAESGTKSSIFVGTTKVVPTEVPALSNQRPVRSNTSVTVFWDQGPVCTGYLMGYNYQLTKESEALKVLESGFTKDTNISFHNLTASTEYIVKVFVNTVAGWNPASYLKININTSATVPEAVRNLTVYKKSRGMLGLRWAPPSATYGQLKSFSVSHSLGQEVIPHTVEPSHCVAWPDMYCHTIEGLRSNRRYNIMVSARNMEVSEDGEPVTVTAITKESSPTAPVNLKLLNSTSTTLVLEWDHPEQVNGILRSFLVSIEETEKIDQDSCCQVYPLVETSVKEESRKYETEVSGLHPASTYFVSVSAKTVGLGPSQSLIAYTRPPHLPLSSIPKVIDVAEVSWLPQNKLPEVNNSDVYRSLIRAHLLLAVLNDTGLVQAPPETGISDPKLDLLLKQEIRNPFYFIIEYNQDDDVEVTGPLEDSDSPWGRPTDSLSPEVSYQLVAVQVLEYNGVYNVDLRYSQPFSSS